MLGNNQNPITKKFKRLGYEGTVFSSFAPMEKLRGCVWVSLYEREEEKRV